MSKALVPPFKHMAVRLLGHLTTSLLLLVLAANSALSGQYQDCGPVLADFNGSPYEVIITSSKGDTARFGLKQISPYQMVMMRGRTLVVYGTLKDAEENRAIAFEESNAWRSTAESAPNWPPADVKVVKDVDVNEEDLKTRDIVLVGDCKCNSITARFLSKLQIRPSGGDVQISNLGTLSQVVLGRFIVPNPLNDANFLVVRFGTLQAAPTDVRWSVAYRWTAAFTYFWHTTDYSFITSDGTVRGGYFSKKTHSDWVFEPEFMVNVPGVFGDPYQNWKTHRTLHFVFHISPGSQAEKRLQEMGNGWDTTWEKLFDDLVAKLSTKFDRSIHIFFFDTWETAAKYVAVGFSPISGSGETAAGLTDAKYGVIALIGKENCMPNVTAKHEIAHILMENVAPATVAFNAEGLATAMEGDNPGQTPGKTLREWESDYLKTNSDFPPLSAMLCQQGFSAYPVRESYPLAASFARFLIDNYGMTKYKDYYKLSASGKPTDAIQKVYARSVDDLQKDWTACVRKANMIQSVAADLERTAEAMYRKREFDAALSNAFAAVKQNADLVLSYFIIGACYNRMKETRPDEAIGAMETYISKLKAQGHPEQPWTCIELGYAYDLKGDREKAVSSYNRAVDLPDDRGSRQEARRRLSEPFRSGE